MKCQLILVVLVLLGLFCLVHGPRGQSLGGMGNVGGQKSSMAAAGGTTPTSWNPADKNAGITLSGSNLIATNNNGSGAGVRTVDSISGTQKIYFEITSTADSVNSSIGLANATWDETTTIRGTTNGIGSRDDGSLLLNFGNVGCNPGPTYTTGSTNAVAIDFANKKFWIGPNTGATPWCADVIGNQNPATNTGGANFSTISGSVFPAFWSSQLNDVVTAVFSSAGWVQTPPSGFVQLGH